MGRRSHIVIRTMEFKKVFGGQKTPPASGCRAFVHLFTQPMANLPSSVHLRVGGRLTQAYHICLIINLCHIERLVISKEFKKLLNTPPLLIMSAYTHFFKEQQIYLKPAHFLFFIIRTHRQLGTAMTMNIQLVCRPLGIDLQVY